MQQVSDFTTCIGKLYTARPGCVQLLLDCHRAQGLAKGMHSVLGCRVGLARQAE